MAPTVQSTETITPRKQVGGSQMRIAHRLQNLEYLRTGRFADCVIKCKGQDFKAHKIFVSLVPRLSFEIREGQDTIYLNDLEPFEVGWLLNWLYNISYDRSERLDIASAIKTHPSTNGLDTRVRMVQIARMYRVDGLEKAALASLKACCDSLATIRFWKPTPWKSTIDEKGFVTFLELSIRQAYNVQRSSSTQDDVRDLLCNLVKKRKLLLHTHYSFCKMLGEVNAFFQERCIVLGCQNCRWAETAIKFELARAQSS